ncbi:MAG: hypothetical protein R6U93_04815 [Dehalococcoidia bacterium]
MPRRMISPEIWRNEKVANLPDAGRLLFIGTFSNADDDGRLKASPRYLRALIFPYDDKTEHEVRELRDKCDELGLIRVYGRNGQEYLDIPGWSEHQHIRKDRYNQSKLPGYEDAGNQITTRSHPSDNQIATMCQPDGNQKATDGDHSEEKVSLAKASPLKGGRRKTPSPQEESETEVCDGEPLPTVKSEHKDERGEQTPAKKQKGSPDPRVGEVFAEMKSYFGYPDSISKDPIPSYGKEGRAIRRMLDRGFTREEVMACWKEKVDAKSGDFVSMTWVNEDVGKKGGHNGARNRGHKGRWSRELPPKYTPTPEYDD